MKRLCIMGILLTLLSSCSINNQTNTNGSTKVTNNQTSSPPSLTTKTTASTQEIIEVKTTNEYQKKQINLQEYLTLKNGETIEVKDIDGELVYFLLQSEVDKVTHTKGIYAFNLANNHISLIHDFANKVHVMNFNVNENCIFYQSYSQSTFKVHKYENEVDHILYKSNVAYIHRLPLFYEYNGSIATLIYDTSTDDTSYCDLLLLDEATIYKSCGTLSKNDKIGTHITSVDVGKSFIALQEQENENPETKLLLYTSDSLAPRAIEGTPYFDIYAENNMVLQSQTNKENKDCLYTIYDINKEKERQLDFKKCLFSLKSIGYNRYTGFVRKNPKIESSQLIPIILTSFENLIMLDDMEQSEELSTKVSFVPISDTSVALYYQDAVMLYIIVLP